MQLYDITIAANSSRRLDAPGTYFYYYSGSAGGADSTITLQGISSGLRIVLKPGQSMRLPLGAAPETSWLVGNSANQGTILGTVMVGLGDIQDNRITGSVAIIDSARDQVITGQAMQVNLALTALAGNLSYCQLWNPTGSGKILEVDSCIMTAITPGSACTMYLQAHDTALSASNQSSSFLIGGANGLSQGRTQQAAAAPGTLSTVYAQINCPLSVNTTLNPTFKRPILIPENKGLTAYINIANVAMAAQIIFVERSSA